MCSFSQNSSKLSKLITREGNIQKVMHWVHKDYRRHESGEMGLWWFIQVGQVAGKLVSAAFPAVMDLKFERVCQPFMMLHVNRSAPMLTASHIAKDHYVCQRFGVLYIWSCLPACLPAPSHMISHCLYHHLLLMQLQTCLVKCMHLAIIRQSCGLAG